MAPLCRGRIVWVELLDPQGRNRKCRPAVIVTPDADIRDDGEVWSSPSRPNSPKRRQKTRSHSPGSVVDILGRD